MTIALRNLSSRPGFSAGLILVTAIVIIALLPGLFAWQSPETVDVGQALQAPSAAHWFGTDHVGRDVYARVVYGMRTTLGVVALSLLLSAAIGGVAGALAGYIRGLTDLASSQLVEVILSFPPIFLGVMITGILGSDVAYLVMALAIVYIPLFFRTARSTAMVEQSKAYVEAAQALGLGQGAVLWRHIIPNVVPSIATQYIILFPLALQVQAALGFLGLGIQPPTPDLGNSLQESKDYLLFAPWMALFPGIALIIASLGVILVGRGLQSGQSE